MVDVNWRDAYRRRADYLSAAIGMEDAKATKASSEEKSSELANAAFRNSIKNSPTGLESTNSDDREERIKKGGWDGFVASAENFAETPVVKGILDALSVGSYTTAAAGDEIIESQKKFASGDIGGGIGQSLAAPLTGIVKGTKAAFGSDEDTVTWADNIKKMQEMAGVDTENDAAKWTQGIGGFIGDVALDPTTYLTFGTGAVAKGAVTGAREGLGAAKTAARDALRAAERSGASLDGTEISRIANNSKGVIGSAIEGAKREHGAWKAERQAYKNDRRDMRRGKRTETIGELDPSAAKVGADPKALQNSIDERQALRQKSEADFAARELERKTAEVQARLAKESQSPDAALATAVADIKGAEQPVIPKAEKPTDFPKDYDKPRTPEEELNKSVSAADELGKANLISEGRTPAEQIIAKTNGPVIDKFEALWQKPKYRNPKLLKALAEPATKRQLVARPDWDGVYADIKANPDQVITVAGKPQKASSLIKNIEENYGGNPNELLPNMGLDPKLVEKHSSVMRKVPRETGELNPATGRREGMGKMAGLGAESRDKKRAQKETGKTHAKKDDMGPQPEDFIKPESLPTAKKLEDPESGFNWDGFSQYVEDHADDILEVRDKSTGVTAKMRMEDFADKLDDYVNEGKYETTVNKFLKGNAHIFAQFDESIDPAEVAAYQKALDNYNNPAAAVDNPIKDELDQIINEPQYDLVENWEDVPNPEAWSPDKAKQYGIDDDHSVLTPQELALVKTPMEARDIRAFITKPEDGITKAELDELRAFTGKTDPKEVADEFIKIRQLYKASLRKKAATSKPTAPKRESEVKAAIEDIKIDSAIQADEILSSPVALDEVAQRAFRLSDYDRALKAPLAPELTGVIKPEFVADAARQAVKKSIEFQTRQGKFKTNAGFQTMTESIENGGAWRPDRWGSDSQIALHSSIWNSVKDLKAVNGGSHLTVRRKAYMHILDIADKELRAMGVEPFLNHVTQKVGKAGIKHPVNLSYYDILKALGDEKHGNILNFMITGIRSYQPTQVQGAAETIIRLRASGAPENIIRQRATKELIGGKVNGAYRVEAYGRPASNAARADDFTRNRVNDMGSKAGSKMEGVRGRVKDARAIVDALMEPNTYRALNTQMLVNHAAHASALGKNVSDLVDETVNTLKGIGQNAGDSSEMLGYLRNTLRDISSRFSPDDIENAKGLFEAKMREHISKAEDVSRIHSAARAEAIRPPEAVVKKQMEAQAAIAPNGKPASSLFVHDQPALQPKQTVINASHVKEVKAAETEALEHAPADAEDFEIIGASIAAAAMRKIHPFQKFVNPRLGLSTDVYRQVNSGLHSVARQQSEFHGSLLTHLAKYGDQALLDDFRELQSIAKAGGKIDAKNPFLLPLDASDSLRELYGIVSVMFSKSAYNVFARNGIGANHFNSLAKASGLPEKWRFQQGVDAYTNSTLWTTWEGIEERGVLDFLSRMHSVAVKASQDISIAASFSANFGKAKPAPGLVKIVWNNRKARDMENSVFYDLIDKDLYYPKDIATQVTTIDRLLTESRHIDPKTGFGKFIVNVFDPVTNALKASQTTVRPGHWTISVAGDLMRNQIAGVNTFAPYKHAAKIMLQGKKMINGEGDEFLTKIASAKDLKKYGISQEISNGFTGSSAGQGVTLYVGGKKVNVNYETMSKLVQDVVQLPKHRGGGVMEDRLIEAHPTNKLAAGLTKATDLVTDNKHFSLNEWAARRDNLMRTALAVDYASKRKWKNLQEMKNGMEEYVTKWAPTSTDFTAFEAKWARRSLLYYTWLRGITPRIIDAAMTKPGVSTAVPKALYNMAYANGLNPESIGDPFPEEGMFPDYYRNGVLGPQWKDDFGMWGINPSSPVIEVANTFNKFKFGDPIGNVGGAISQVGGMATPFARIPAELATGTQASTGVPIKDEAQYLADNLGGSWLSSLSRATGKTINPSGIVDRTDSAAKDTPEQQAEHAKLQLINFLTGAKLTDYQSEAAKKAAAYDLRDTYRNPAIQAERSK